MNRDTVNFTIRAFVTWFTRAKGPERWIFGGATAVLIAAVGGWAFKLTYGTSEAPTSLEVGASEELPLGVLWSIVLVCLVLMVASVAFAGVRFWREQSSLSRKRVLIIEGRGLRHDDGKALKDAVPRSIPGHRQQILLDLRQHKDGVILEPDELIGNVPVMKNSLLQLSKGGDRSDLTIVYGGVTSVPFTYLTGVLLDDEGEIVTMDWDRSREEWRTLDGPDDGARFEVSGLDSTKGAIEIVLAVSASYMIRSENLDTTFTFPVVRLTLPDLSSSHWSNTKQVALSDQFLDVAKKLDARGVKRIHLVLATQNSMAFTFGRRYDKRNLPPIVVYQYEQNSAVRYPWGVDMPVAGQTAARVVRSDAPQ